MSKLKQLIIEELTKALKNRETFRLEVIRLLKAELMKVEVSGKSKRELTDEDIVSIISRMVKQRRDSAELFRKGDREEMANKEEGEIKILQEYLPPQLANEEIKKIVEEVILQLGAKGKSEFGKVMGAVMGKVKGKADGNVIKLIVEKLL